MKKIVCCFSVIVFFFFSFLMTSHSMESMYLDIGLTHPISSASRVSLYSKNGFSVFSVDGAYLGKISDENITVEYIDFMFRIIGEFNRNYGEFSSSQLMFSNAISEGDTISIGKYSYRGYIKFIVFKNRPVVINRIEMEEYLRGVVPSEMSPSFPKEALKSQAICSRSFAYANINKMSSKGYNLDDTSICQVYFGTLKEDPRTDSAVRETKSMVAVFDGKVANTIFFSQSHGWTENSSEIWGGGQPYLTSVFDPFGGSEETKWKYEISKMDLENILYKNGIDIGNLLEIKLNIRSSTRSVSSIEFVGTKSNATMKSSTFRTILGSTKIKSTFFRLKEEDLREMSYSEKNESQHMAFYGIDSMQERILQGDRIYILDAKGNLSVKKMTDISIFSLPKDMRKKVDSDFFTQSIGQRVIFYGKGYGHGVGMPQLSAKKMADQGRQAAEIISFFYKGVTVEMR